MSGQRWCEHCDQPMSTTGRFSVSSLTTDERKSYRHNGRVAVVPLIAERDDDTMCEDCARFWDTDTGDRR